MCGWGLAFGCLAGLALLAAGGVLPNLFTGDPDVLDRAHALWPLFALMAPIGGIVFALDGILLGSGDTGYLAVTMVIAAAGVFAPLTLLAGLMDWGVIGVWCAIDAFMVARLIGVVARFRSDRWLVLGAPGRAAG
jgi:Na+-driven multidrug efflux pump